MEVKKPKVSVLVPMYNVEKYIRRCMISIQRQSLSDIEIIVVNDCTPDNSMTIVQELAENDQRIKILNHEQNMGLMWTRRTGYKAATGDYITFCDSDDYLPEIALETLYDEAVRTNADVVSGIFVHVTVDGKETKKKSVLSYGDKPEPVYKALLRQEFSHNLCGKLFKAYLLHDYEYQTYDHATNGEDGCLFYQIVQHVNKVVQIETPVYYYMQNLDSSTQKRLNEKAIRSICLLSQTRIQVIDSFPDLKKDLDRCVTNIMCGLYAQGYQHDANLGKYIHICGLDEFLSLGKIVKYLDYSSWFKTFLSYRIRKII